MKPSIITIGVYGFTAESFLQALLDAHVDTFCDLRAKRGMRGSAHVFANSKRLQEMLQAHGIRYIHLKALAPLISLREIQRQEDKKLHELKRNRVKLADAFINIYERDYLNRFDTHMFLEQLGEETQVLALCCVEREPAACHRSLVAQQLAQEVHLTVTHILP
jgi:uncharacterized protein (DUF488 family)